MLISKMDPQLLLQLIASVAAVVCSVASLALGARVTKPRDTQSYFMSELRPPWAHPLVRGCSSVRPDF
jgi:hypothetical protein